MRKILRVAVAAVTVGVIAAAGAPAQAAVVGTHASPEHHHGCHIERSHGLLDGVVRAVVELVEDLLGDDHHHHHCLKVDENGDDEGHEHGMTDHHHHDDDDHFGLDILGIRL